MKNITPLLPLFLCASLFGQATDTNASRQTLDEIAVQGSQLKELDLSRATVLGGGTIEDKKISSVSDLSGLSPSLYVNSNGIQSYGDVITLRGIGNTQLFGDPAVSLYVDGVPAGNTATYSSALFDLESVEILKGSQGHRFGKNSPGGVINIKTRRAGDIHRSKLFGSYASFDTQNYRILADGPTGETSSYYFGLNRTTSDGFADNINPLGNDATYESWNGRLGFDWVTADGLEVGLGGTWEEFELGAQPLVPRAGSGNLKRVGFYDRNSSENEIGSINSNSQYLKLTQATDFGRITSVTTRNDWEINPSLVDLTLGHTSLANADVFFGDPFVTSTSTIIESQERIAEELTFSSDPDENLVWNLGLLFSKDEIAGTAERTFPHTSGWQQTELTSFQTETDSIGVFGSIRKPITENTSFELGLRYDNISRDYSRNKTVTSFPLGIGNNWTNALTGSLDDDFFTPSIALTREINENLSVFSKASVSYKPGGFSPYVDSNFTSLMGISNNQFSREENFGIEIGANLKSPDESWNLNITAFLNEVEDYQFEKPTGTTDYFVDNAEDVEIFGIEVELEANPNDRTTFSLTYGLVDGEIKKHVGRNFNTGTNATDTHNFAGKSIPYSPEQTFGASLGYLVSENIVANLGVRNIGKIHYLDQTATDTVNDSYTLLNASIGYASEEWEMSVFGTNLTDEEYYSSLVSSLEGAPGIAGSPRVIGLSISREF